MQPCALVPRRNIGQAVRRFKVKFLVDFHDFYSLSCALLYRRQGVPGTAQCVRQGRDFTTKINSFYLAVFFS